MTHSGSLHGMMSAQIMDQLRGKSVKEALRRRGRIRSFFSTILEWLLRGELSQLRSGRIELAQPYKRSALLLSLTTWTPRLDLLPITLLTLVKQRVAPKGIIVWLTDEDRELTASWHRLFERFGVSFATCRNDGPHKKWLPVLEKLSDESFVICDDDTFYPTSWFEELARTASATQAPCIVAHRCHRMVRNSDSGLASYTDWEHDLAGPVGPNSDLFATGCGGTLLRKQAIPPGFRDADLVMRLCPKADDIWLKCAAAAAEIRVLKTGYDFPCLELNRAGASSLMVANIGQGANDEQIARVQSHFRLGSDLFFR
jgi:hypothetical protein